MNRAIFSGVTPRQLAWAMTGLLACASLAACASAPPRAETPAVAADEPATTAPPASDAAMTPPSDAIAHLRQLIDNQQLTELRTTYNGGYGASLLFQTDTLDYYISLFHNKEFWRVIQTESYEQAEQLYRTFAKQTEDLAQVDLDALRLQAGKKYTEHMVALNQQRLQSLRNDMDYQQQQAREVAALQKQAQQDAVSLTAELRSSSSQLDAVKKQIRELEAQRSNPELLLPASQAEPDDSQAVSSSTP